MGTGTPSTSGVSRRSLLLGTAGGTVLGALAGAGGAAAVTLPRASATTADTGDVVNLDRSFAFYDVPHQAGIQTEQQRYSVFMTFDLSSPLAADLRVLLARWTAAIAQMVEGRTVGQVEPTGPSAVGADTGEALDLAPAGLTVTVGLGPGVFDDRFGLAARKPALLAELPALPSDQLEPRSTGGDISVQACADDPQVAYHAVRNLARMARGTAATRWTVVGFGRASAGANQHTPRNLMGFKDGTRNIRTEAEYERFVWADETGWATGGSYQVVRKIQMHIENWDTDTVADQQAVFGRSKVVGAPLTGKKEFDTPDFAKRSGGDTVIDPTAHIALAAHENNGGVKIMRRGYNYTDGLNRFGLLDAGLLFIAYMNDPEHFVAMQRKLGSSDRLNEYIQHIGSGVFYAPRAPWRGSFLAADLFTA